MSDSVKFEARSHFHLIYNGDRYIRFSSDCWYKFDGNSLVFVSDCTKLEQMYIVHYYMD
jgi:hypothetical protein